MIYGFFNNYRFLSNFHLCSIPYEGLMYPSTEHAFQAAKTLDPKEREFILEASTPGRAKRAGRLITLRPDWEEVKLGIMYEVNMTKYDSYPELKEMLLATGDEKLVEGNTWGDTFWGQVDGVGKNYLGNILMQIRKELREGL
jgi:ribA/ribD-fused uncharacterized protein